jgi:hypothetical protein
MSPRIRFLLASLCIVGSARAEDGIGSDPGSWVLLLFGFVAIGVYAAVQMHRD